MELLLTNLRTAKHNSAMFSKVNGANRTTWRSLVLLGLMGTMALPHLQGQAVVQFDDPNGNWNVARTFPQGNIQNPNFAGTTTQRYYFDGDTLINGNPWQRMVAVPTWGIAPEPAFKGYTRQEGNLVLFQNGSVTLDTLYNFALQVGDTMRFGVLGSEFIDFLSVEAINQVMVQGVGHKVFHFSTSAYNMTLESYLSDTWIEGIGSIHGPLAPMYRNDLTDYYPFTFPDSTRLTCYGQGGAMLWQHGGYPACTTNIQLAIDEVASPPFQIYPNPAHELLTVESAFGGIRTISLLDATGRVVLTTSGNGAQTTVGLGKIRPGPYVLRLTTANGIVYRTRLTVQ